MWICSNCSEENEETFNACWSCLTSFNLSSQKKISKKEVAQNKKITQKNKDFLTKEPEEWDEWSDITGNEPDVFNKTFSAPLLHFFKYDINMSYFGLIQQFLLRLTPAIFFVVLIYFFEEKMPEIMWILLFIPMGIVLMGTIFASFGFLTICIGKFFNNSKKQY